MDFDRKFYDASEEGETLDLEDAGRSAFLGSEERFSKMEERRQREGYVSAHAKTRQAAWRQANDAWEENRLIVSGVVSRTEHDQEAAEDDTETRVHLLVHDIKPQFLDGKQVSTPGGGGRVVLSCAMSVCVCVLSVYFQLRNDTH